MLRRFITRLLPGRPRGAGEHETDYQLLGEAEGGLESEYEKLITLQLVRWGVQDGTFRVDVRQIGVRQGKPVVSACVLLLQWNRTSVLRVLLGLPALERRVRRSVSALWLADVSVLEGISVRATERLQTPVPIAELRQLLIELTKEEATPASGLPESLP